MRRIVVALVSVVASTACCLVGFQPAAHALDVSGKYQRVVCQARGTLRIVGTFPMGSNEWYFDGAGACGNRTSIDVVGEHYPSGAGCPDLGALANFTVSVHLVENDPLPPGGFAHVDKKWTEHWLAPYAQDPGVTAFETLAPDGSPGGAGFIASRILGQCPPAGTYDMTVRWTSETDPTTTVTFGP